MSSTWPWSLDTDAVLRAKFHTAAELAIIFEKLVHQISLVKEALPEIRESGSELTAIMIRQARLAIERLTAEFVPGSLLNDNLRWFVGQAATNTEKQACEAFACLAGSGDWQTGTLLADELSRLRPLAELLARFRKELEKSLRLAESDPATPHWFFRDSEGVQIFGVLVPVTGNKAAVLVGLCSAKVEHGHSHIAGLVTAWDKGQISPKQLGDRIQEIRKEIVKAFGLSSGQDPISCRKNQENDRVWKLDREMLEIASLKVSPEVTIAAKTTPRIHRP